MNKFYYFQNGGRCRIMNHVLEKSVPEYLIENGDNKKDIPYYFILDWNVQHHYEVYRSFLRSAGIRFVETVDDLPDGAGIYVGGYGADPMALDEARMKNIPLVDDICPWIKFLEQDIKSVPPGYQCVILIDKFHIVFKNFQSIFPENTLIVNEENYKEELKNLDQDKPVFFCVYATFRIKDFDNIQKHIEMILPGMEHIFSSRGLCPWSTKQNILEEIGRVVPEENLKYIWLICNSQYNRSVLTLINEIKDSGAEPLLITKPDDIPEELPERGNIGVLVAPVPYHRDQELIEEIKKRFAPLSLIVEKS